MTDFKTPYRNLVSPLTDEEYEALKNSIEKGYWKDNPIIVTENMEVLCGHHRLKICRELAIDPPFIINKELKTKKEKIAYVIKENLIRRQLNKFQKVELAIKLLDSYESTYTDRELAKVSSVSQPTVYRSRIILEKGFKEEIKQVRNGEAQINTIFSKIKKRYTSAKPKVKKKKTKKNLLDYTRKGELSLEDLDINSIEKLKEQMIEVIPKDDVTFYSIIEAWEKLHPDKKVVIKGKTEEELD